MKKMTGEMKGQGCIRNEKQENNTDNQKKTECNKEVKKESEKGHNTEEIRTMTRMTFAVLHSLLSCRSLK